MAAEDIIKFNNGVGFITIKDHHLLCQMDEVREATIPFDGWIVIMNYRSTGTIYGTEFRLNGTQVSNINNTDMGSLILPVKKGQIISWNSYARGDIYIFKMQY